MKAAKDIGCGEQKSGDNFEDEFAGTGRLSPVNTQ